MRANRKRKTDYRHMTVNQRTRWYMAVDQLCHGKRVEEMRHGKQITLTELPVIYMPQMVDV